MDQHGLSGPPPPPQPPPLMNNNGLQNSPRSPISPMGTPVTPVTPNSTDMFHQSAYPSSIIRRMFGQDGNGLGFPMGDMGRHSLPEDFFANAKFAKQIKKEPHQNGSEPMSPKSMANMVHPDRRHICPHCYKGFKSRQQLTQHNLVHSNVRKYKCNYCERAFKQLSHLHQHHRIHTGEKPYKCPLEGCDRAFPQLSNLQHHIRNHDKLVDSKFQCLLCNRAYPNEATLKAHNTRTHLHGKPLDLTQQQQAQRAILQQAKETTAALMAIAKQQEQDSQFPPHLQSHGLSRSHDLPSHDLSPHGHQNHNGHMLDHHEHQNSGGKSSPVMVDENGMRSSPDDLQEPIKQRKRKASRPQHLYFHPSMADGTENQLSPDENQMDLSEKSTKNKKMVDKNDNIGANGRKDLALYERNHLSHEPQQLKEDRNASRDFNPSAKIQEYMNNPNFMRQKMLELQNGNFLKQSLYNAMEDLSDRPSPRSSPHGTNLMNGSSLLKQMAADSRQVENMFPGMGYGNKTFEKVSHSRGIDMNLSALSKFNNSLASSSSRLFMSENSPIYHSSPGLLLSQSHLNQNYPSNPSLSHSGALVHDSITGRGSGGPYSSLKLPAYSSPAWTQGLNRENLGLCNGQEDMGQHRQLIDNVEDRCQDFSSTQMDTFDEPMN